ncbi:MAG: 6-hydroxymethylpterin diphosphokinase MptE-like protein [Syntrophotaleaceae bacterium]
MLLKRSTLQDLTVTILNPAVAWLSFGYFDHSDWLADPRVTLGLGDSEQALHRPFAAAPACLLLAGEQASGLRDRVFLELATPYIRKRHQLTPQLKERLEQNSHYVTKDRDVAELFGSQNGQTMVVAAAGPTLSDHYDWLAAPGRPPLVAVDATLKPLLQAGISPDFVVSIDAYQDLYRLFYKDVISLLPNHIPLIYFPTVASEVLAKWPGPRFAAYPTTITYRQMYDQLPKAKLFSSGSVLHPAVDLALQMGAQKVILAGADLSYPNGRSHVFGCGTHVPSAGTGRHWVLNGHGEKVSTTPNMRGYLRDLEDYLGRWPEKTFINASKKGAAIRHTSYLEELP